MADQPDKKTPVAEDKVDAHRRDFLRTSIYAAYATPLITTLLVTGKAAAQSTGNCPNPTLQELCDTLSPGDPGYDFCQEIGC